MILMNPIEVINAKNIFITMNPTIVKRIKIIKEVNPIILVFLELESSNNDSPFSEILLEW